MTVNVVPGVSERANSSWPWCASAIQRAMERPSPAPPLSVSERERALSARKKRSKMRTVVRGNARAAVAYADEYCADCFLHSRVTLPPLGVYLMALSRRFRSRRRIALRRHETAAPAQSKGTSVISLASASERACRRTSEASSSRKNPRSDWVLAGVGARKREEILNDVG